MPGLGGRLRTRRLALGMSLRQLARTLGVSASFVSQIENGKSQPSVATLYQICQVLEVSVDELFVESGAHGSTPVQRAGGDGAVVELPTFSTVSRANDGSPVVSPDQRRRLVLDSGVTWEKLSVTSEPAVDFMFVRYDPDGSSTKDGFVARHNGIEYGYIISGTLTVTLGFETYVVGPQQSISFDSSTPHRLANHGSEPVEAIWFVHGRNESHTH
jgi:transcriptional regulator with XRE-family HTH domain